MKHIESMGGRPDNLSRSREIHRNRRKFSKMLRTLPPETQDFLSEISSVLTEPDLYRQFTADPGNINNFRSELESMGLEEGNVRNIFRFFNFPYGKKA